MIEQFKRIYNGNKVEEIIPFLKQLTGKERKELGSWLVKEVYYSSRKEKETIFLVTGLVCCTLNQLMKKLDYFYYWNYPDMPEIEELLEWNPPIWFSDFLTRTSPLPYGRLLEWQQKGYYTPVPESIAHSISNWIADRKKLPINEYPVVLKEHIWHLLEYNIYTSEKLTTEICSLVENNYLNKADLIKACLNSSKKNLDKDIYNWIAGLIKKLNILSKELLPLQKELINSLQYPHTQFQVAVMDEIKKIIPESAFQANCLTEAFALLLSGTIKKINQTGLQLAELVTKHHPEQRERCCEEIAILFLNKDESMQTKTAKIILRYGDPASAKLRDTLMLYQSTMLYTIKQQLQQFIPEEDKLKEVVQQIPATTISEKVPLLNETNRVPVINTFDELLYFATQAFSNAPEIYSLLLPYYLQKFDATLSAGQIQQFEPIYILIKKQMNQWGNNVAFSNHLIANFMVNYARYLAKRYPEATQRILDLTVKEPDFDRWKEKYVNKLFLHPIYYQLQDLFTSLGKGETEEPLHLPTHTPLWIDPDTLVKRLINYQQKGKVINTYDIQMAIQRCCLEDTESAINNAEHLTGEIKELILFLFGKQPFSTHPPEHPAWWTIAALSRNRGVLPEEIQNGKWDIPEFLCSPLKKWEVTEVQIMSESRKGISFFNETDRTAPRNTPFYPLIDEYYYYRVHFLVYMGGDMYRYLVSKPYDHDILLAGFIQDISFERGSGMMDCERAMQNILQAINDLKLPLSSMDHLAIAYSFFNKHKDINQFAAELWNESIRNSWGNPALMGELVGKLITSDWLPLKRFTDILQDILRTAGTEYQPSLLILLDNTILHIRKPVKNLRVLLEVYKDLLIESKQQVSMELIPRLKEWGNIPSLKKTVKELKG